jgi:signal transduction histidine kinase
MNEAVPGDQRGALLDFIRRITLDVPVVIYTSRQDEAIVLDTMKAGASDCIRRADGQQYLSRLPAVVQDAVARNRQRQCERERLHEEVYNHMMETLRASVAKVTHDINNPLAIISGNAQLLSELGRYMDLDEEIIKPIKDIEEASTRIATSLHRLASLKDLILHEKAQGDGSLGDLDEGIFSHADPVPTPGTASPTTA